MKLTSTQFGQRVITAIFFGVTLLVPLFIGKITGLIILGILCLLTILEYLQLQGLKGRGLLITAFPAILMYIALSIITIQKGITYPVKYATYLSIAFCCLLLFRLTKKSDPFNFNYQGLPATLYIAIPIALLFAVANWTGAYKPDWLVAILLFVWINDILAYVIGKSFGVLPFSKEISPNKTWEGTLAGWFGCILIAVFIWEILGILPLYQWILLGILVGITSSLGDLIESLYKRKRGIKDSGTFLPGHGGFLDRLDSLLFAAPFIALFFLICL